jgi:hypothetical protein
MTTKENKEHPRPMNVYVRRGSKAEKTFRKRSGSPIPKAIVPGIAPSPDHDLKYQGGKTIQNLRFMNFYVGGDAWNSGDIANVDKALAAAMSDPNLNNVMVQYFPGPITTYFDGSQTLEPSLVVCTHFVDYLPDCCDDGVRRFSHVVLRIHDDLPTSG